MKVIIIIWIDLTNAPHVHFFCQLIKEFEKKGIDYVLTYRESNYLRDLINFYGFAGKCIGKHGVNLKEKLIYYAERIIGLTELISNLNPILAIAKHSVELPRVAFGLNIPTIFVVDNEHATAQNKLTLPLVDTIIKPKATDEDRLKECGGKNFIDFAGTCEVANINARLKGYYPIDKSIKEKLNLDKDVVVMRPCPNSSYCNGHKDILPKIIKELKKRYDVDIVVFPRNNKQKYIYKHFDVVIPNNVDALSLIYHSDFMIGAGGTMNRESAILGIPTISCYPQDLLGVDKFLIEKDRMIHTTDIKEILYYFDENLGKRKKIAKFEDPIPKIFKLVCEYL